MRASFHTVKIRGLRGLFEYVCADLWEYVIIVKFSSDF